MKARVMFKKKAIKVNDSMKNFKLMKSNLNRGVDANIIRYKKDSKNMCLDRLKNFVTQMNNEKFLNID